MTRTPSARLLSLAVVIAVVLLPAQMWAGEPTKPNVVYILADDIGYVDVGC